MIICNLEKINVQADTSQKEQGSIHSNKVIMFSKKGIQNSIIA